VIGSLKFENERDREAVIIGAGISGLLTAYVLDKNGFKVTLYEEAARAGGLISTTQNELGLMESAAHSFLVTSEVAHLCRDLNVELVGVRPESRARFILRRGKMRRFPLSFFEAVGAFFRAYFILSREDLSRGHATLEQWGHRHLGKAAVDYLLSPFLTGIYAARPSEICVGAAFPALEVPAGHSLISARLRALRLRLFGPKTQNEKGKHMMVPKEGMGALVGALEKRLEKRLGERFRKGEKITHLPEAPNVILAVPASRASELLAQTDPLLSSELSKIQYAPLVSATLFVPRNAFPKPPKGVGVLIPEREGRRSLGVLFNSSAFPGRVTNESEWASLTMMLGGSIEPSLVARSDSELTDIIQAELKSLFGLSDANLQKTRIFIHRWPHAIPKYDRELMDAWSAARSGWCSTPGHLLVGNYTGQVSIRGMMQDVYALSSDLAAGLHVK